MMTIGEQRHMAVVESSLRRIAEALEKISERLGGCDGNNNESKEADNA